MILQQLPQSLDFVIPMVLPRSLTQQLGLLTLAAGSFTLAGCASPRDTSHQMIVSVPDQKMAVLKKGKTTAVYPVSTSKFGIGDKPGSYATPEGRLVVARKIGTGAPSGSVFRSRRRTGEVLKPNAPGRDPIVSRILWLSGTSPENRNSYSRFIYIHGTTEEKKIGIPVSFGCIRMRSKDVIDLYSRVGVGAQIDITREPLRVALAKLNGVPTPANGPAELMPHPAQPDVARIEGTIPTSTIPPTGPQLVKSQKDQERSGVTFSDSESDVVRLW